jgi:hypothetical protein
MAFQDLELPDADAHVFDVALPGAGVAGVVVDAEDGRPQRGVVSASPVERKEGRAQGSSGASGADGRFTLDLEPGAYTLMAFSEGYARASVEVTVAETPGADVRVALTRGLTISGKVLDARGRGVGGMGVFAATGEGREARRGMGRTLPDGSFTIEGLEDRPYAVSADDEISGFAFAGNVAAGTTGVVLRVIPGGKVVATVLKPDGTPARALVFVGSVDGQAAGGMVARGGTNEAGVAEFAVPAGRLELRVSGPGMSPPTVVTVGPGETVPVEIRLAMPKPPAAPDTR